MDLAIIVYLGTGISSLTTGSSDITSAALLMRRQIRIPPSTLARGWRNLDLAVSVDKGSMSLTLRNPSSILQITL